MDLCLWACEAKFMLAVVPDGVAFVQSYIQDNMDS